jgi:hypothetical protein
MKVCRAPSSCGCTRGGAKRCGVEPMLWGQSITSDLLWDHVEPSAASGGLWQHAHAASASMHVPSTQGYQQSTSTRAAAEVPRALPYGRSKPAATTLQPPQRPCNRRNDPATAIRGCAVAAHLPVQTGPGNRTRCRSPCPPHCDRPCRRLRRERRRTHTQRLLARQLPTATQLPGLATLQLPASYPHPCQPLMSAPVQAA